MERKKKWESISSFFWGGNPRIVLKPTTNI
jgi:hypothetical protein